MSRGHRVRHPNVHPRVQLQMLVLQILRPNSSFRRSLPQIRLAASDFTPSCLMMLLSCGRGPFRGPFHDPCRGHLHQGKHSSACRSEQPFLRERSH